MQAEMFRVRWLRPSRPLQRSILTVDEAVVLHNSNKLALRLMPCDVFARSHM